MDFIDIHDKKQISEFRQIKLDDERIEESTLDKYLDSLIAHISYVQEAGRKLGIHDKQLRIHDQSKFSDNEFIYYARHFHGGGDPDGFAFAWLHHMNNNPHHWQYWIFPDKFTPKNSTVENGIVMMPGLYALEMVADWMGASMAYTGSWDMQKWLWENMPRIKLHSGTADYIRGVLDMLGYADTVYMQRWGHEPEVGCKRREGNE